MASQRTLVGVISDTHGVLRPEALDALRGSALIIHAGDVGAPDVLNRLGAIAPTFAVRGNVDVKPWAKKLPLSQTVDVGRVRLFVLHRLAELDIDPGAAGYGAVISGHSHRPAAEVRSGVLYLNPGSAGPRRFSLPITVARLEVVGTHLSHEIVQLRCP
jgi:putative phosphoesterase